MRMGKAITSEQFTLYYKHDSGLDWYTGRYDSIEDADFALRHAQAAMIRESSTLDPMRLVIARITESIEIAEVERKES